MNYRYKSFFSAMGNSPSKIQGMHDKPKRQFSSDEEQNPASIQQFTYPPAAHFFDGLDT